MSLVRENRRREMLVKRKWNGTGKRATYVEAADDGNETEAQVLLESG